MLDLKQLNHSLGLHQLAQSKKNAELDSNIIEIRKYQREMEEKHRNLRNDFEKSIAPTPQDLSYFRALWERIWKS